MTNSNSGIHCCSSCYIIQPLPGEPDTVGYQDHSDHRFIRMEKAISAQAWHRISRFPQWGEYWEEKTSSSSDDSNYGIDDPLLEHSLSASHDVNKQLILAIITYWRNRRVFDDRDAGEGISELSAFPSALVEYVKSHCFLRRTGRESAGSTVLNRVTQAQ